MRRTTKPNLTRTLALTGVLCAASGYSADAPTSVEDRLKLLEKQVQGLVQENTELKKQLGWDGKKPLNLVEDKGKAGSIGVGGYIQAQAGFGNAPDPRFTLANEPDGFNVRRARINVFGKFAEHFDFKVEGDFAGLTTGMRAQLTDGFVNWNRYDFANIKVGQFKTHFGYEQLLPDTDTPTVERSYPNDRLTIGRQIGLSVTGSTLEKRLAYAAGIFNGNNVNNGVNDGDDFVGTARIEGTPLKTKVGNLDLTAALGINGLIGEDTAAQILGYGFRTNPTPAAANNLFNGQRAGFGVDTQWTLGPVALQAEFLYMHYEPSNGNLTASPLDDSFASYGYYVTGIYDILPKKLQAVVKWESLETDDNVGATDADVLTVGLNYFIKGNNLKLQANYLYGQTEGGGWEGRFIGRLQAAF